MISVFSLMGSAVRSVEQDVLRVGQGVPVDPDAPDARDLLINELARPPYREAQPSWFDRLSEGFLNWIASLFEGGASVRASWLPIVAVVILVAIIVIAIMVWGVPRLNRRSRASATLFGERDARSANEMRSAAAHAAAQGQWPIAIAEQFRALATDLTERTIVSVSPGTTATDFARAAGRVLITENETLAAASVIFDEVRYLDHPGSEADYRLVQQLDERVRATGPSALDKVGSAAGAFSGPNGGLS